MTLTANEQLLDAMIRHQIELLRLSTGLQRQIRSLLAQSEEEIRDRVLGRLGNIPQGRVDRAQALIATIKRLREANWQDVLDLARQEVGDLAVAEPVFFRQAVNTVIPVTADFIIPTTRTLRQLVINSPFEGRTMRQWFRGLQASDLRRITDQINLGIVQGEGARVIAQRVRQQMQTSKRNAESIARTAVNHISNQSRREFLLENRAFFDSEQYVATLDSRTSPVCRSLDGRRYGVGEGPIPPVHINCRSLRVAVIDGEVLGRRPFKASTERQLITEFAEENGLGAVRRRKDLPRGTKGAFDSFARQRIRALTGTVPAKVNYGEFLTRQSAAFQNDVLGPTRARLFRQGNLTLDKFVDRTGREIPLDELAGRQRQAFIDAGLDPADF